MTAALNTFQNGVLGKLREVLEDLGVSYDERVVEGKTETYVEIHSGGFGFWVYRRDADIQGKNVDSRFEWQDFDSPDALGNAFLSAVRQTLVGNQ